MIESGRLDGGNDGSAYDGGEHDGLRTQDLKVV